MNRLSEESSPYLRQHAENPVDWWPWCADALARAQAEDKPILLSIGYSACHWCHVMAHESFEDEATARLMNALFVCIKVDREERPDLDKIYQLAHQALTRRAGGWPLTVFLTPDDHLPFYAGTYFPKDARYGMPPFAYVLEQVRGYWDTRRDDVRRQNAALAEFLADYDRTAPSDDALSHAPIDAALARFRASFDAVNGGHLGAPRFPHCPEMELMLDLGESAMVDLTLARMADGGIHDQIGGGFCRYSVDERWEIPHFEKMLYDNAQLLSLYARRTAANARFGAVAHELVAWLVREMTTPDGAFFAALDADSEHEEGKFYVWRRDEIRGALSDREFAVAERRYGFDRPANFEGHAWNPLIAGSFADIAQALAIGVDEAESLGRSVRDKLFAARAVRVRPGLDDKVLTAWNALMIGALARTARRFDAPPLMDLAAGALDVLYNAAWRDGRLFAKAGADAAKFPAYLDDHAFLLAALLDCLRTRFHERDLAWAILIAEALLERFEDREHGGFHFTAHDHERLIQRPKPYADEAVPSGNGIAARALLALGHLVGEPRYLAAAERTLRAAWTTLADMPQACASLLRALADLGEPRTHVVVRAAAEEVAAWRSAIDDAHTERCDVYVVPPSTGRLPGALAAQPHARGGLAYVCRGTRCLAPIAEPAALAAALRARD